MNIESLPDMLVSAIDAARLIPLLLALACAGEPFTGQSVESVGSYAGESPIEPSPTSGAPNSSAGSIASTKPLIPQAGQSGLGGHAGTAGEDGGAGTGEGGAGIPAPWRCSVNSAGVCGCYVGVQDVNLVLDACPISARCATRGANACACWSTDSELESFLALPETRKVETCPP